MDGKVNDMKNLLKAETGYKKAGIYWIFLFDNDKGTPVKIPRFGGVDDSGLLSIGYSENIEKRRKDFIRSINGKHGHSEGISMFLVTRFWDKKQNQTYKFEFIKLNSEVEAKEREKIELQNYFKKYLEPPPLNSTIPQRQKWFDKLRME